MHSVSTKTPETGFLLPDCPGFAARPRADIPGYTARLCRSCEEEDPMPRPKSKLSEVRSRVAFGIRLREQEWAGLKHPGGADSARPPSRLLRRLLRRSPHRRSGLLR